MSYYIPWSCGRQNQRGFETFCTIKVTLWISNINIGFLKILFLPSDNMHTFCLLSKFKVKASFQSMEFPEQAETLRENAACN